MATLIPKHRPYPAYRPSGVEWLGDVPTHWEVQRIKWVAELNPSRAEERACLAADTPVTFLPMERVGTEGQIDVREKVGASQVWNGYTYFRRGDILVAKITPCFENGKGAYLDSLPTEVGFGSTEFHVLRAKPTVTSQFLYRLTTDCAFRQNGTESMTGAAGQQRVPADFVANYQIPLPPLAEQRAIATFLDRETAKIDALVSKKERLIELLQEKRTALINHTVTKGLYPDAPMKDSGIEWLGEIPAHWNIRRINWIANLNPNSSKERTRLAADTPVTFLPMERVGTKGQIDTGEKVGASQVWNGYTYFQRGDILVAKITPCFENGKGAYLNSLPTEVGFGSTEFHVLRAKPSVHPLFLYRITTDFAFRQSGTESMTGAAGQQRVSADFVADYQIPLPPLDEQAAIAAFLDRETAKLNSLVAKVYRAIELLWEMRTALISAAVTGQIDVREEAGCT